MFESIVIDPGYLEIGLPAVAVGILLGALIVWLASRGRIRRLTDTIKSQ